MQKSKAHTPLIGEAFHLGAYQMVHSHLLNVALIQIAAAPTLAPEHTIQFCKTTPSAISTLSIMIQLLSFVFVPTDTLCSYRTGFHE